MSGSGRQVGLLRAAASVAGTALRSSLRDRSVVVYAIVLPLALYPVLFWVLIQGSLVLRGRAERTEARVVVAGEPALVDAAARALADPADAAGPGPLAVEARPGMPVDALERLVRDGEADAAVALGAGEGGGALVVHDASRSRSTLARDRAEERLALLAEGRRAEALGAPPDALEPYALERVDRASAAAASAYLLSLLLPMLVAWTAVAGCLAPAIDLTAGERERGTLETTLLLPVPRPALALGKLACVVAFGLLAALLNLGGLLLAAEHLLAGLASGGEARFAFEVPWGGLARSLVVVAPFLVGVAGVVVAAGSRAATVKQAQAMAGLVQTVVVLPAVAAALPGFELDLGLAVVPVLQTVLGFKALLQGEPPALEIGLVVASELVYASLAVLAAARLGTGEAALAGARPRLRLRTLLGGGEAGA